MAQRTPRLTASQKPRELLLRCSHQRRALRWSLAFDSVIAWWRREAVGSGSWAAAASAVGVWRGVRVGMGRRRRAGALTRLRSCRLLDRRADLPREVGEESRPCARSRSGSASPPSWSKARSAMPTGSSASSTSAPDVLEQLGLGPDRAQRSGAGADHGAGLVARTLSGNGREAPVEGVPSPIPEGHETFAWLAGFADEAAHACHLAELERKPVWRDPLASSLRGPARPSYRGPEARADGALPAQSWLRSPAASPRSARSAMVSDPHPR